MALDETKRLPPAILNADREGFVALTAFDDYLPRHASCTRENLAQMLDEIRVAQEQEINLANALAAARDAACQKEWQFHNAMLDVKVQVIAQYGFDSDQIQALGFRKKSEHRRPGGRAAPINSPA